MRPEGGGAGWQPEEDAGPAPGAHHGPQSAPDPLFGPLDALPGPPPEQHPGPAAGGPSSGPLPYPDPDPDPLTAPVEQLFPYGATGGEPAAGADYGGYPAPAADGWTPQEAYGTTGYPEHGYPDGGAAPAVDDYGQPADGDYPPRADGDYPPRADGGYSGGYPEQYPQPQGDGYAERYASGDSAQHLSAGVGTSDPETIGLRRPRRPRTAVDDSAADNPDGPHDPDADGGYPTDRDADEPGDRADTAPTTTGGRVARRQAEKARRATRTSKIANAAGELMITVGVLLMLFVTYQLWWTNVEARAYANGQADELLDQWDNGGDDAAETTRDPGAFSAGDGFALLYMPTLDVRVPIAEGVDPGGVLDRGMIGRYSEEDGLPTALPWDDEGNVGLAGHRNTHGEPFRYINRLDPGDPIIIETESTYYLYEMRSRLDSTSPSNTSVLDPVPVESGFTEPGRYLTLTTCTPEFSSTYRLIVWGELVEEQPRSEGLPDALGG